MVKNIFKIKYLLMFGLLIFFIIPNFSFASEIDFKTNTPNLGIGDEFTVQVILNTQGQSMNAISGDINFDDSFLSAENVIFANSIVPVWIDSPHISGNSIVFSGIMPGGYQSTVDPVTQNSVPGVIFNINFKVKSAGQNLIQFNDIHVYKNDGLGTEDIVSINPFILNLNDVGSNYVVNNVDIIPPENFTLTIFNDKNIYDGKNVLIFSTNDKQSGIDHYEIKEGKYDWIRSESPYLLLDQNLSGEIDVKAIDLAGNYTISKINKSKNYLDIILLLIIAIILFISLLIHRSHLRYHKKRIRNEK
ncbi:MAG: cohesin domain-containing protein [Candidatus Nomurabacteria bacterium]|nr:cohesin domain-containing protein [Candidatus Nomurabacteria bacterium]